MRNFFLVLVLANLGFAAWHSWFAKASWPSRHWNAGAAGITLINEIEPAESVAGSPGGATVDGHTAARAADARNLGAQVDLPPARVPRLREAPSCVSIGPFSDNASLERVRQTLSGAGYTAAQRESRGNVWIGQWVYIDAIATQAEANEIVDKLKGAGITEAYVIADANNGYLVSLGVFSESARAELRLNQARTLGYEPTVSDRTQPGRVNWLDIDVRGEDFSVLGDLLAGVEADASIGRESCPGHEDR